MKLLRKSGGSHFFDSLRAPVHTPPLPLIEFYGIHERGRERNAPEKFKSSAPPDREAVRRAVAAWLSGVLKA